MARTLSPAAMETVCANPLVIHSAPEWVPEMRAAMLRL
jgi:hypothetical protein